MTATNHTLAGIGLTTVVANPVLLVVLAFCSHFILDALPHFGMPGVIHKSNKFLSWLVIDIMLMLCAVGAAMTYLDVGSIYIILGAGAAVLPDVLHINKLVGEKTIFPKFQNFHARIQWYERPLGITGEFMFAAIVANSIF